MSIKIALTNLGKYNEGDLVFKWLELPATETEMQDAKDAIGIDERYEEWFISDYEAPEGLKIGEYDDIDKLNDLASEYDDLGAYDQDKISAALETGCYTDLKEALEHVDDIELYPDVKNDAALGYYLIEDSGCYDLKSMGTLARYIDYESFGRDVRIEESGGYTSYGYVAAR